MNIKPLYQANGRVLVGLARDHIEKTVRDSLAVEIDIEDGEIIRGPWSGQKRLKFGYFYPIEENEVDYYVKTIKEVFSQDKIAEIENLLLFPPKDAVESLIWIPERLKNIDFSNEKYDMKELVEKLINIRHEIFESALNYAMANELRSLSDSFDVGDKISFRLRDFDFSDDINLKMLVELIEKVERTVESLANLNKIDLDEFDI